MNINCEESIEIRWKKSKQKFQLKKFKISNTWKRQRGFLKAFVASSQSEVQVEFPLLYPTLLLSDIRVNFLYHL